MDDVRGLAPSEPPTGPANTLSRPWRVQRSVREGFRQLNLLNGVAVQKALTRCLKLRLSLDTPLDRVFDQLRHDVVSETDRLLRFITNEVWRIPGFARYCECEVLMEACPLHHASLDPRVPWGYRQPHEGPVTIRSAQTSKGGPSTTTGRGGTAATTGATTADRVSRGGNHRVVPRVPTPRMGVPRSLNNPLHPSSRACTAEDSPKNTRGYQERWRRIALGRRTAPVAPIARFAPTVGSPGDREGLPCSRGCYA